MIVACQPFRLNIFEAFEQFVDQTYAPSWLLWVPACAMSGEEAQTRGRPARDRGWPLPLE